MARNGSTSFTQQARASFSTVCMVGIIAHRVQFGKPPATETAGPEHHRVGPWSAAIPKKRHIACPMHLSKILKTALLKCCPRQGRWQGNLLGRLPAACRQQAHAATFDVVHEVVHMRDKSILEWTVCADLTLASAHTHIETHRDTHKICMPVTHARRHTNTPPPCAFIGSLCGP